MSDPAGESIIAAVRSVRRFTEDVAKLLSTAREILADAGWESRTTQAITVSTSLNIPRKWIPQDAFWFVFNKRFPNHLLVVSVLFDTIESPSPFTVPVVMSGCLRFAQPVTNNWQFRWSRLCEHANALADGEFCEVPRDALGNVEGVQQAQIAVRPLTSLTSAELLEQLVLIPLLAKAEEHSVKHSPSASILK